MLLVAHLANTILCKKNRKMNENLAHGYSSESTQWELSNEYQHDRVWMFFEKVCFLVLWTNVASALEGLNTSHDLGLLLADHLIIGGGGGGGGVGGGGGILLRKVTWPWITRKNILALKCRKTYLTLKCRKTYLTLKKITNSGSGRERNSVSARREKIWQGQKRIAPAPDYTWSTP